MLNEESIKLLSDKSWRMQHLYKIVDKDRKLVTFKFNQEQQELFNKYTVIKANKKLLREHQLKNRQIGMTTFHCIWYLDEAIFNLNRNVGIIAHEQDALEKIFVMVKTAWLNMPEFIRPKAERENTRELYFPSVNSAIFITLKARSGTLSDLHISEYAKIKDVMELKAGSMQAAGNGNITVEYTANGLNHAYTEWWDENMWHKHFFSWLQHKEYRTKDIYPLKRDYDSYLDKIGADDEQRNWWYFKHDEIKGTTKGITSFQLMQQEYPATPEEAFITTGSGVFKEELDKVKSIAPIDSEIKPNCTKDIFEKPILNAQYVMGVDPSGGYADGDKASIYVINKATYKVAARWHGTIAPDLLGIEAAKIGRAYNLATIAIEVNNHGLTTINAIKDDYPELWKRERRDTLTNTTSEELGWLTTEKSKNEIIDFAKQTLRDGTITELPKELIREMQTFILKENGSTGAQDGCNDDEVMGFMICLFMVKCNPIWEVYSRKRTYMGR